MRRCEVLVLVLAACSSKQEPAPAPVTPGSAGSAGSAVAAAAEGAADACSELPFASSTPVPEASGAAWIDLAGKPSLLVVSDSGNHGAYAIVDGETGDTKEQGTLPLGKGAGEDIEGLAVRGERVYGLNSAGWVREWKRDGAGFALVAGPYPLGPVDMPPQSTSNATRPSAGNGMVCDGNVTNCGRNYEGLCLAPAESTRGAEACVGFAASKSDGRLYCVTLEGDRLRAHHDQAIAIDEPGRVADCAFSPEGKLVVGNNLFGLSKVVLVEDWATPTKAKVTEIGKLGPGFPESIAAKGDVIYRLSDTGGAPSLMAKFRCPAIER